MSTKKIYELQAHQASSGGVPRKIVLPDGWWLAEASILQSVEASRVGHDSERPSFVESVAFAYEDDVAVNSAARSFRLVTAPGDDRMLCLEISWAWYAPSPFGVVIRRNARRAETGPEDRRPTKSIGLRLVLPRQIHQGELGKDIPAPRFKTVIRAHRTATHSFEWVPLRDLASAVGLEPEGVVSDFLKWAEFGSEHQPSFIRAKSGDEVMAGKYVERPKVESKGQTTMFLAARKKPGEDDDVAPFDEVWVAMPVARKIARAVSVGLKRGTHDMLPSVFI